MEVKRMATITLNIIEDVYALGKRIVEGTLERKDAILTLSGQDMNQKSANMYLTCICALLSNTHYGSTVNASATEYFMRNIYKDYGKERLAISLNVLEDHIKYQEGKNNLPSLRQILDKYRKL